MMTQSSFEESPEKVPCVFFAVRIVFAVAAVAVVVVLSLVVFGVLYSLSRPPRSSSALSSAGGGDRRAAARSHRRRCSSSRSESLSARRQQRGRPDPPVRPPSSRVVTVSLPRRRRMDGRSGAERARHADRRCAALLSLHCSALPLTALTSHRYRCRPSAPVTDIRTSSSVRSFPQP